MIGKATASSSSLKDLSEHRERKSHNKLGANQYKDRPLLHDPRVADLLNGYHAKGFTDNRIISKLLKEEHNVILGERSIYRRKKMLGLWASKRTTQDLSDAVKRQLVMTQMAKDTTGKLGAQTIKKNIFLDTGLHLTRDYIRAEMKKLDPVGHAARNPAHNKMKRLQEEQEAAEAAAAAAAGHETTSTGPPILDSSTDTRLGGYGNGQPSVSQQPSVSPRSSRTTQNVPVIQQPRRPPQPVYSPTSTSSAHFSDSRPQASTSRSAGRTAQLPTAASTSIRPTQHVYNPPPMLPPGSTEHTSSLFSHTMAYPSTSYDAPVVPPPPPPPPPHTSSPLIPSTSPYHQSHNHIIPDDQNDDDADYSEDEPEFDIAPSHLQHAEPTHPTPPTSTVRENTRPRTTVGLDHSTQPQRSATMEGLTHRLQDTTANMQDLTRVIQALSLEDESLDSQSYSSILQAMEAAALLERQLSRVISHAR